MADEFEQFYEQTTAPADFSETCSRASDWCARHVREGRRVALVTSGGTTVPLERNTVRFVDNFSVGTRGAASCEHFLAKGYAVAFLHRDSSVQPFVRHFSPSLLLKALAGEGQEEGRLLLNLSDLKLDKVVASYRAVVKEDLLLSVPFLSLSSYLWYLKGLTTVLQQETSQRRPALLYLAAAVADFYIPNEELSEHKIQSSEGPLSVTLHLVPKMLRPLVRCWGPGLYVVSFKLETDACLLHSKAARALQRYGHHLVVGNLLHTRREEVTLLEPSQSELEPSQSEVTSTLIKLTEEHKKYNIEIEQLIVAHVCDKHSKFIQSRD